MNHGDTDAAVNDLANQLQNGIGAGGIGPGLAWYSIRGSAVAFVCNRGTRQPTVLPSVVGNGNAAITSACGSYIAGTWRIDPEYYIDYGYMVMEPGLDFCGHAEGSGSGSC